MESQQNYSDALKDILIQFSVSYLLDRPGDVVDFAVDYFKKMQSKREESNEYANSSSPMCSDHVLGDDEVNAVNAMSSTRTVPRRNSVLLETFHPGRDKIESSHSYFTSKTYKTDAVKQFLFESMKRYLVFQALEDEILNGLIDVLSSRTVQAGEYIYKQGDQGDTFFIISEGVFEMLINDKAVSVLYEKDGFGELALLHPSYRVSSVRARTSGMLWAIDRYTFRCSALEGEYQKRLKYEELLDGFDIFKALNRARKTILADAIFCKTYKKGDRVYSEGDESDGMYFIQEGSVSIFKQMNRGTDSKLFELGEGQHFGEIGLITHGPRPVTVYANTDVKAAFLDIFIFERLIEKNYLFQKNKIK